MEMVGTKMGKDIDYPENGIEKECGEVEQRQAATYLKVSEEEYDEFFKGNLWAI
jgi:hypothetical protein